MCGLKSPCSLKSICFEKIYNEHRNVPFSDKLRTFNVVGHFDKCFYYDCFDIGYHTHVVNVNDDRLNCFVYKNEKPLYVTAVQKDFLSFDVWEIIIRKRRYRLDEIENTIKRNRNN